MESETAQKLMEIQSASQKEELAIESAINCDEPGETGDRCSTFKRPMTCSNVVRHLPLKANWTAMKESILVRNHSAAQGVRRHSHRQVI